VPRIYLFCTAETVFHGGMLETLLDAAGVEVAGAAVFPGLASENGTLPLLRKILALDGPAGILRLAARYGDFRLGCLMRRPGFWRSVGELFRSRNISPDAFASPNDPACAARVRSLGVDFVLNNQPRILGREVLEAPARACLNRHTSALPAYRGLEPVFHAKLRGEERIGVSVHSMTPTIDGGRIYAQGFVSAHGSVLDCYRRAFAISAGLFREAMENVLADRVLADAEQSGQPLYRRPTTEEIRRFRDKGLRYA
jgi:hypothetical protein